MSYEPGDWRAMLAVHEPRPGPAPPPAPRPARYRHLGWLTKLFVVLSLTVGLPLSAGGVAMLILLPGPWDDWVLDFRGETARGVVTKVETAGTGSRGNTTSRTRDVYIDFTDERGKRRSTMVLYDGRVGEGDAIEVEYDPKSTERARIAGASVMPFVYGAFVLVAGVSLAIAAMVFTAKRTWRELRLYRYGTAVEARVTAVKQSASRQGQRRVLVAHYEYDTPQGAQAGTHRTVDPPGPGAKLWVVYDPRQPQHSLAVHGD